MDTQLWSSVDRRFRKSDIGGAITLLEKRLAKETIDRFKGLLGATFSNPPADILSSINEFVESCEDLFEPKAVYLEMNGFDINPERWYFDFFAYAEYGSDPDDLDWLSDWQSQRWNDVTLQGLETVQADFDWYHSNEIWNDKTFESAYDVSLLLVMCKYVALIESSLRSGARTKSIPVLATAHDFDMVGRFPP